MKKPFIIAEISCNHGGKYEDAEKLIIEAKYAGADAVKLQTFKVEHLAKKDYVIPDGVWVGKNLKDLYEEAQTPWDWHKNLFKAAKKHKIEIFSTPFHPEAVSFLEDLKCPYYKISSFDIGNEELLREVARTQKKIILSTGMADKKTIDRAMDITFAHALLQCTSAYPAPVEDANLAKMDEYRRLYGVSVGLSDHTVGIVVPIAAAARGADIIEKHIKLNNRTLDASFSLFPETFAQMVRGCRQAAAAIGGVKYGPLPCEMTTVKEVRSESTQN